MKSLEDEALLRLIVQKKSEALSELYDRYSRLVFSLALHIVGDQETAEEITQDVG
jgi:RNA polymerase sigma-70 factor (ECF subfamily)